MEKIAPFLSEQLINALKDLFPRRPWYTSSDAMEQIMFEEGQQALINKLEHVWANRPDMLDRKVVN